MLLTTTITLPTTVNALQWDKLLTQGVTTQPRRGLGANDLESSGPSGDYNDLQHRLRWFPREWSWVCPF